MSAANSDEPTTARSSYHSATSYYSTIASTYDQRPRSPTRCRDVSLIRGLVARQLRHLDVIEIAPGTGEWTGYISQVAATVVALDVNEAMLKVARQRCAEVRGVRVVCADAYNLPLRFAAFSGAFAGWWLSHVPKECIPHFLDELSAKLTHDSVLIFADDTTRVTEDFVGSDANENMYARRKSPDGRDHHIIKNLYSREELASLLAPVGRIIEYVEGEVHWGVAFSPHGPPEPTTHPDNSMIAN